MGDTDSDPDPMKTSGGHHEAHAVEQGVFARGQLRSVRVAMEDPEEADQARCHPHGGPRLEGDHDAQEDGRERNPHLGARERHPEEAEEPAEGHDHREDHRQEPDRGGAELRAPQTDGDHGENVIEAGDRVLQPGQEAGGLPGLLVSPGRDRGQQQEERQQGLRGRTGGAVPDHRGPPRSISVRWIVQ